MIQTFTIKTIIILVILVVLIIILAYFLRKKLLEDDTSIPLSSRDKTIEDLRRQDIHDTITNIRDNTSYVSQEESEKLDEYSARKSVDGGEII